MLNPLYSGWKQEPGPRLQWTTEDTIEREDGKEFLYRLWLIEEDGFCPDCNNRYFGFYAEEFRDGSWQQIQDGKWDDYYTCEGGQCDYSNYGCVDDYEEDFIQAQVEKIMRPVKDMENCK